MKDTLRVGDYVAVKRFAWSFHRGDILIFRFPGRDPDAQFCGEKPFGKDFIKRVIGLPGEELEIKRNAIYIEGKFLEKHAPDEDIGPLRVPSDSYFVMGDNRVRSCDSRTWGPVPASHIKGKAWFILWPPGRKGNPLAPRA